ncbi:hypothetical protein [Microtetraspora glauca]|uniref:Secreted protein n=1 Tax=Microtetraspora glauca TaxID=1996 RepID=A0ABV3GU75_MICGL
MRKVLQVIVPTVVLVLGLPAGASATAREDDRYLGMMRSASGHSGYAQTKVWDTGTDGRDYAVYGRIYDRDRHSGHCGWVRARFHFRKGGSAWSPARWTCASAYKGFLFEAGRDVKGADLKICIYQPKRRATSYCRTESIYFHGLTR